MAEISLIELNSNDELITVIKKTNTNLKRLVYSLSTKTTQAVQRSSSESSELIKDLENKIQSLTKEIQGIKESVKEVQATLLPPIGSYMHSKTNPATHYKDTTWTKVAEGTVLLSAGTTYDEGTKWQLKDSKLSEDGSLFLACPLWLRTKQKGGTMSFKKFNKNKKGNKDKKGKGFKEALANAKGKKNAESSEEAEETLDNPVPKKLKLKK